MSIIVAILVFSIIIIIHELGHFLLAKKNGIGVVEFSIGLGPTIWGIQKGETKFSIKLLPFGGLCQMVGEDTDQNTIAENGNESFILSNEKVEGVVIAGTTEILETAKFEANVVTESSPELEEVLEQAKENKELDVKEDTKIAVVEVDLWAADGTEIHEGFGTVTVTIDMPETLKDAKEIEVFRVEEGTFIPCEARIVEGKIVFETNHFSTFLVKEKIQQNANTNVGTGSTENDYDNNWYDAPIEDEAETQNVVASAVKKDAKVTETTEKVEKPAEEVVKEETVVEESVEDKTEEKNEQSSEITILEEEIPLAANAGGNIPVWPVLLATAVFLAFVGLYVVAKQRKMIK